MTAKQIAKYLRRSVAHSDRCAGASDEREWHVTMLVVVGKVM